MPVCVALVGALQDLEYDASTGPVPVNDRGYRTQAPRGRGGGRAGGRLFSAEDDEELVGDGRPPRPAPARSPRVHARDATLAAPATQPPSYMLHW